MLVAQYDNIFALSAQCQLLVLHLLTNYQGQQNPSLIQVEFLQLINILWTSDPRLTEDL